MKVGIIGVGVLGKAHRDWLLQETSHEVLAYDHHPENSNCTLEDIYNDADIVVLCVPTNGNDEGKLDTANIEEFLYDADQAGAGGLSIVIRSTVPVGFTRKMAGLYPRFKFYFVPEFLTEKTADEDFRYPLGLVIGSKDERKTIVGIFPRARIYFDANWEEAELVKLATNSFYAMKVIFANEIHDYCKEARVDYQRVKRIIAANPRIGSIMADNQGIDVHLRIAQDGKAGYGGKCLPKDTRQLVELMKENGSGFGLLEKVDEINERIRQ